MKHLNVMANPPWGVPVRARSNVRHEGTRLRLCTSPTEPRADPWRTDRNTSLLAWMQGRGIWEEFARNVIEARMGPQQTTRS